MNGQISTRRMQRRERIDISSRSEVMYWAGLWGLSDQELHDAVAAVGTVPADVAAHIGQPLAR